MAESKYLIVDKAILPDVYEKVVEAKDLLRKGKVKGITDACKKVSISRSTFYKYKDYVFTISDATKGRKVTINMLLDHHPGILSDLLKGIARHKGNILTISQDIPINDTANVSITFDVSNLDVDVKDLVQRIKNHEGVIKIELIAME